MAPPHLVVLLGFLAGGHRDVRVLPGGQNRSTGGDVRPLHRGALDGETARRAGAEPLEARIQGLGILRVVIAATARLGHARQLLAGLVPHAETDGVDLEAHTARDQLTDLLAGIGRAGLLPVGDQDDVALAAVAQVLRPFLQRVRDGGVTAGLELVDRAGQARLVQGTDGVGQPGVGAGTRGAVAVDVGAVDPEADLGVRGHGVEGVYEGLLRSIHLGSAGRVRVLHRPRGIQHQQDLGCGFIRVCGGQDGTTHGHQQQGSAGRRQAMGSVHRSTSNLCNCESKVRCRKCQTLGGHAPPDRHQPRSNHPPGPPSTPPGGTPCRLASAKRAHRMHITHRLLNSPERFSRASRASEPSFFHPRRPVTFDDATKAEL